MRQEIRECVAEFGFTPQEIFSSKKKCGPTYFAPVSGSTWTGAGDNRPNRASVSIAAAENRDTQRCVTRRAETAFRLSRYRHGIAARCRHPLNTSIVEGINNTIKVIKRRAYGYRDEECFFLKIRAAFPGILR